MLVPECNLSTYAISSRVHFLNLFLLVCISSVTLTDTFCDFTDHTNWNSPWHSWDFLAYSFGCAGTHSIF